MEMSEILAYLFLFISLDQSIFTIANEVIFYPIIVCARLGDIIYVAYFAQHMFNIAVPYDTGLHLARFLTVWLFGPGIFYIYRVALRLVKFLYITITNIPYNRGSIYG